MNEKLPEYEFGITSLVDKHEFLQKGDVVQFQIGITKKGKERAVNIKAIRARIQVKYFHVPFKIYFLKFEVYLLLKYLPVKSFLLFARVSIILGIIFNCSAASHFRNLKLLGIQDKLHFFLKSQPNY